MLKIELKKVLNLLSLMSPYSSKVVSDKVCNLDIIGYFYFCDSVVVFAKTDEVVFAIGKLEPKGDVKDIQIPIGGVIEEIFVEAGFVDQNQKLIQLDRESS